MTQVQDSARAAGTSPDVAAKPEKTAAQAKAARVSGADLEFLPAALEILETPAAPRKIAFMLTICAFAALALVWSFFGRLDVHATAWGKVEASGRSKVVQPFEAGKIDQIAVSDGAKVKAGDLLVALDDAEAAADERASREAMLSAKAEATRRAAAIVGARVLARGGKPASDISFGDDLPEPLRARERAIYEAELLALADSLTNVIRQITQREATIERLQSQIEKQEIALKTSGERVTMRTTSMQREVGSRLDMLNALEQHQRAQVQVATDKGQQAEMRAAIAALESEGAKTASSFIADNEAKRADALRKAEDFAQQHAKAQARLARTRLVAPIDGVVQQLAATTIGQVVTTGQQLMTITPQDGELQVDVFVSNIDIGFVRLGQHAEVKVDAFPFTRFGSVPARVTQIAADAIDEQEAKRRQSNAVATGQAGSTSNPGQPQIFVFPVRLTLERSTIEVYGKQVSLTPGMTVTAEIKTDQRRVIDYLLSPIARVSAEAMRER